MIIEATTATGAKYQIDRENAFWRKIDRYGNPQSTERLWDLQVGESRSWPWQSPEDWRKSDGPMLNKHLYVSGRDVWWVSTLIVEIREIESWMDVDE